MTFPIRQHNLNSLWANLLLEELWRLGVRDLCIAPGSRSAPLTLAAADMDKYQKHVHFDERGLGFFALGLAKSSNNPVVVITTSGSAVANLYPALVEAKQFAVPLILITADRPTELLGCGANQAIQQQGIFADYPAASVYWPAPDEKVSAGWLLGSIDQAFARSCQKNLPMHINCMFREPLYPNGQLTDYGYWLDSVSVWCESVKPYTEYQLSDRIEYSPQSKDISDFSQGKGLIVVGRLSENLDLDEAVSRIVELAEVLGWPIIADIQSPLHGHQKAVKYADLVLATPQGERLFADVDRVLQLGSHLVSKRLNGFLEGRNWHDYWLISSNHDWLDPGQVTTRRLMIPVPQSCQMMTDILVKQQSSDKHSWSQNDLCTLSNYIGALISDFVESSDELTELWLGHKLTQILPSSTNLFVGNSLPVRLLDSFSGHPAGRIFSNRGASGIDGLLATAAGCAMGSGNPLLGVIGDLSFLHDLNSMQLLAKISTPVVIVMVNNDGGGIFSLLPVEKTGAAASEYFQTPHGLDARNAAEMFGIRYLNPVSRSEFTEYCLTALDTSGCTFIEVKTQPGQAAEQIREVVSLLKEPL